MVKDNALPEGLAITRNEYQQRLEDLRRNMQSAELEALILVAGSNMRYFTGLSWSLTERMVGAIVTAEELIFICPKFEESALRPALKVEGDWAFWEEHESPSELVAILLKKRNLKRVAVDPKSPLWLFENLQKQLTDMSIFSAVELIGQQRAIKSQQELALITHAMQTTLRVHQLTYDYLRQGLKASEIIHFINEAHHQSGADNGSYFCAVQFNDGTSHPHGVPGDPTLTENTLVLIDTGCQMDGYHSDITRTYAFGEVSEKVETLWRVEKQAQLAAFDAAKPGRSCESVDFAARQVLIEHGLGPEYKLPGLPHRTGHGIGLEIHEGPYLVMGDKTALQAGMCFSNEPMIVVPGEFGIRLEDHFYITESGAAWFTEPQKSLYNPF